MSNIKDDSTKAIFDIEGVNAIVPMRRLSVSWNGGWKAPPYMLPRLDRIATSRFRDEHNHTGMFSWSDPKSGKSGEGAVSLVAHILKIEPNEAARRIMAFLLPGSLASQQRYLDETLPRLKGRRYV